MTDYTVERDSLIGNWYGRHPEQGQRRPRQEHAAPNDTLGIPIPVNLPFHIWGMRLAWKYGLNKGG